MNRHDGEIANFIRPRDEQDEFHNPERRGQVSGAAFRVFLRISSLWDLTGTEQRRTLGDMPETTYQEYVSRATQHLDMLLSVDELERISLLLGIYASLHTIYGTSEPGAGWIRRPNTAAFLRGRRPVDLITGGSLNSLWGLRRHLDAVCAGY